MRVRLEIRSVSRFVVVIEDGERVGADLEV